MGGVNIAPDGHTFEHVKHLIHPALRGIMIGVFQMDRPAWIGAGFRHWDGHDFWHMPQRIQVIARSSSVKDPGGRSRIVPSLDSANSLVGRIYCDKLIKNKYLRNERRVMGAAMVFSPEVNNTVAQADAQEVIDGA